MKHFYIARHGLKDWNLIPKVQGMTDIPLNEGGLKQAYALAETVKEQNLHFVLNYEGGESMFHLAHRIYTLLDELKAMPGEENFLLVTHGGIARCIHSYFYDMTNEEYSNFQLGNCEIREYKF